MLQFCHKTRVNFCEKYLRLVSIAKIYLSKFKSRNQFEAIKIVYKFDVEGNKIGYTFDGLFGIDFSIEEEKEAEEHFTSRGYKIVKNNSKQCATHLYALQVTS